MKELVVTLHHIDAVEAYIKSGVDAIVVGAKGLASRLPVLVDVKTLSDLVTKVNKQMKIYVEINQFIHEDRLDVLQTYLKDIHTLEIDAILFQDFAVVQTLKELGSTIHCHYQPETLNTNYATMNVLKHYGISRFSIARELSKEEMVDIAKYADVETELQCHGVMYVAHSRRKLLSNYLDFEGLKDLDISIHGELRIQADNQTQREYVFEDEAGTHILTEDIFCLYEQLAYFLASDIKAFRIDTLYAYDLNIIQAYKQLITTYNESPEQYQIVKETLRPLFNNPLFFEGFVNDGTVYTIEKVREREEDEKRK